MNQLGKNLVLSLCVVATLLVILGLKRKFARDDGKAALLSQQAEDSAASAPLSTTGSPPPRVVQAKPITQQDRTIVSPTSSQYGDSANQTSRAAGMPISPVRAATSHPSASPRPLDAPELVPLDQPSTSPVMASIGEEQPGETPGIDVPTVPVAARPVPAFVLTGAEDSFWSISKQVYGSGAYYRALFRHNEANVLRPDQLRAGVEVRTPPLEVLRERYPHDFPPDSP